MAEEKLFEKRLERYLEKQGIYPFGRAADRMPVPPIGYYEKRWGGGFSKSGLPDLHLVANAISLDVELKAPTGRPSPLQKFMVSQINNAGSIGVILYPDGFEDFKKLLEGVIQCNTHIPVLFLSTPSARRATFYYQMICPGTVEEDILEALKMRKDYTDELFKAYQAAHHC